MLRPELVEVLCALVRFTNVEVKASSTISQSLLMIYSITRWAATRQFRLRKSATVPPPVSSVHATEKGMENEHLRVTFVDDGTLSIYDKDSGAEVFRGGKGGARAVVLDDPSDTWSHHIRAYTKEVGAFGKARFRLLENGPLRATVRVRLNTPWSFRHFRDMKVEACAGQKGGQLKGREALTLELRASINAGLTFHGLTPRPEVLQEGLGSL